MPPKAVLVGWIPGQRSSPAGRPWTSPAAIDAVAVASHLPVPR
ncbi:hypothetical protein ACIHFD_33000 [Nonomuraea sp. NPDC051941]